jgi:hypothetical protein
VLSSIPGFDDLLDSPTAPLEYGASTRAPERPGGEPFDTAADGVGYAAFGTADDAATVASASVGFSLSPAGFHSPQSLR